MPKHSHKPLKPESSKISATASSLPLLLPPLVVTVAGCASALAWPGSGVWPVLGTAAGWGVSGLLLWRRRQKNAVQRWQAIDSQVMQLTDRTEELFRYLSQQFTSEFSHIEQENRQVQDILADAIDKLINSFTGLEKNAGQQQELALSLAGRRRLGEGQQGLEGFLKQITDVLQTFVQAAQQNSRVTRELMERVQRTNSDFQDVLQMLTEVRKIADQTNLLAINAAVEAARAGQAGRGFAVVAEEVRNLSVRSNKFSERIEESVERIAQALRQAQTGMEKLAEEGTSSTQEAQQRMDGLLGQTQTFNSQVAQTADSLGHLSEEVGHQVRSAVTSLQFQDLTTQVLGHVTQRVQTLGAVLEQLADLALAESHGANDAAEDCRQRLEAFQEGLERATHLIDQAQHSPVSQKSLAEGDIELF